MIQVSRKLLAGLRKKLMEAQRFTTTTLQKLSKEDPLKDPDHINDHASSDTDAFEQSSHERIETLQKELLRQLDTTNRALDKIKNNTYGKCELCKKPIEPKRLEILPTATECVSCERAKKSKSQ